MTILNRNFSIPLFKCIISKFALACSVPYSCSVFTVTFRFSHHSSFILLLNSLCYATTMRHQCKVSSYKKQLKCVQEANEV